MSEEETITLSKDEYDIILRSARMYWCLEAAGVDNWGGWDDAMDLMKEYEEDE